MKKTFLVMIFVLLLLPLTITVKGIESSFKLDKYDEIYDVNDFESNIIGAPTVWVKFHNFEQISSFNDNERPVGLILEINNDLTVKGSDKNYLFGEIIDLIYKKIIPVFQINDDVVDELNVILKKYEFKDYFILDTKIENLQKIKSDNPYARTVYQVDIKKNQSQDLQFLKELLATYNQSNAQVLFVSGNRLTKQSVEYLQKRGVMVFTNSSDDDVSLYQTLVTGVNGILVFGNHINLYNIYKSLPINTIIRKNFVIAHRGYFGRAPENTIEAGQAAIDLGADIIELDIRFTRDLEIVVIHDDNTERISDRNVAVKSMWSVLKTVELRNSLDKQIFIPLFSDYLDYFKDKEVVLFVELKEQSESLARAAMKMIEEHEMTSNVMIISFNKNDLLAAKDELPTVGIGYLLGGSSANNTNALINEVIDYTVVHNTKYNPSYTAVDKDGIKALNARGISVWPWTINGTAIYNEQLRGSFGTTTDSTNIAANIPVTVKTTFEKNSKRLNYSSEIFDGKNELVDSKVIYQIINDDKGILKYDDIETFRIDGKGKAYLLGSYEYEFTNGVKINVLTDVFEVDNSNNIVLIASIGVGILIISVGLLVIIIKKNKKGEIK
ncbi:glycerophosphodiester phosphodiesterase [Haploplasma axanthum]|nr:glycerophosphodiester phosphodiesterase [Haploplasma axanthum]